MYREPSNERCMCGALDCAACFGSAAADSLAEDEALDAIADEIWAKEIGDPVPGNVVEETLGEVLSAMDEREIETLGAAFDAGPADFGDYLMGQVVKYLEARCRLKARQAAGSADAAGRAGSRGRSVRSMNSDRRANYLLRRHVSLVEWMVEAYQMQPETAVQSLTDAGMQPERAQCVLLSALNSRAEP